MIHPARLWQPRQPAFWLMLAFNALSLVLAWLARSLEPASVAAILVALFAVGNALFGLGLAARLLRTPTAVERCMRR